MTASALDDSSGTEPPSGGDSDHAAGDPAAATEHRPSLEIGSDDAMLAAIGGSGALRLETADGFHQAPGAVPTASSMRAMETGLAFLAILVALLLNLGR